MYWQHTGPRAQGRGYSDIKTYMDVLRLWISFSLIFKIWIPFSTKVSLSRSVVYMTFLGVYMANTQNFEKLIYTLRKILKTGTFFWHDHPEMDWGLRLEQHTQGRGYSVQKILWRRATNMGSKINLSVYEWPL